MKTIRDTWLIFRRSLVLTLRQPTWLIFGIMYPLLYLVLFGPLLDGVVSQVGGGVGAYNWFVPGLLVQVALFGSAFVGFGLIAELRYGVVERMRVTPMSRTAMLLGRSLRDVVLLLVQALLMVALSIPFGLHLDPAGVAVARENPSEPKRCPSADRLMPAVDVDLHFRFSEPARPDDDAGRGRIEFASVFPLSTNL